MIVGIYWTRMLIEIKNGISSQNDKNNVDFSMKSRNKSGMDLAEMSCNNLSNSKKKKMFPECFYAFFRGLFFSFSHFGKVEVSTRITYMLWHYVFVVFCVFCTDAVRIYCYLDWYLSLPLVSPRKLNQIQS